MNITEKFDYSLHNLRYRQLRTWLTILGIVIGIAAIVILIGLAGGLKANVEKQLSSFDPNTILVVPINIEQRGLSVGFSANLMPTSGKLFERDYIKVKNVDGVKSVAKLISNRARLRYKNEVLTNTISGVEPEIFSQTTTFNIAEGRFLTEGDKGAAVLGYSVANDYFKEKVNVGSEIEIAGRKYQVIGILQKSGSSLAPLDSAVFIKFDESKDIFSDQLLQNEISGMRVVVAQGYNVSEVRDNIEQVLLNTHKVTLEDKDFSVIDSKKIYEQVDSIIQILTIFLGAVAAISLIVGSIGVSNTMFMAVMERTHEIGVLKAIGATRREILLIFMIEAGLIGLVGGILGIIVGASFSLLISFLGINTMITPELIIGSSLFAFIVGLLAGILPAKRASEVPAIEALRYE